MDAPRFDRLARILGAQPSRRGVVRALAGLAVGGLAPVLGPRLTAAACRPLLDPCTSANQCCSGLCQVEPPDNVGRCCKGVGGTCSSDLKCCTGKCRDGHCCKDIGTACNQNASCCSGLCGVSGRCCRLPGATCEDSEECCSSLCDNGTCACADLSTRCERSAQCCRDRGDRCVDVGGGNKRCSQCARDSHCPEAKPYCRRVCADGNICTKLCQRCRNNGDCPSGRKCCSGDCVDTDENVDHCGSCGNRCPENRPACHRGECVECRDDNDCAGAFRRYCLDGACVRCRNNGDCQQDETCDANHFCTDHCFNGRKDFNETDVDCGGGTCPKCSNGQRCTVDNDCGSGSCTDGFCRATVAGTCDDSSLDACSGGLTPCNGSDSCWCITSSEGTTVCAQLGFACAGRQRCTSSGGCPTGQICTADGEGCCYGICISPCA